MNTETKTLRIRKATHLDAVNLYRLLVDEEKRAGTGRPFDEAARMAHILVTIATGYVTVATLSGRIVGSIGAALAPDTYVTEQVLAGQWLAILPSFRDTKVGPKLAQGLARFADFHKSSVQFLLPLPVSPSTAKAAAEAGFVATAQVYTREPGLKNDELASPQKKPEPARPDVDGGEFPTGF